MTPASFSARRSPSMGFILLTAVIDVMGIGLVVPVLPGLVGQFAHSPDAQTYWYGALVLTFAAMQFLSAPLLGALSDRYGRRPVLLLGIAGLGLNFLATALATSLWMLLASRIVGGAMSANLAVINAYVADVTPREQRARRLGMVGATFGIGFILGPVIGGLLGNHDARLPFFAAAALAGVNFLYGWLVLPESLPPERRSNVTWSKVDPFAALRGLAKMREIGLLVAVIALANLAQFILHTIWVLYTTYRFGWGPLGNGFSLFVVGVVAAVMQGVLLSRVLRVLGHARTAMWGLLSAAIAFVGYGSASAGWVMYLVILFNALGFVTAPALQALVSSAMPADRQGATFGALTSLNGLCAVLAPLIASPLFAQVSHLPRDDWRLGAPFFLGAVLLFAAYWCAQRHFAHAARRSAAGIPVHDPA